MILLENGVENVCGKEISEEMKIRSPVQSQSWFILDLSTVRLIGLNTSRITRLTNWSNDRRGRSNRLVGRPPAESHPAFD